MVRRLHEGRLSDDCVGQSDVNLLYDRDFGQLEILVHGNYDRGHQNDPETSVASAEAGSRMESEHLRTGFG